MEETPKVSARRPKSRSRRRQVEYVEKQLNVAQRINKRLMTELKEVRKVNADLKLDVQFLRSELKRFQYRCDDAVAEVRRLRKLPPLGKEPKGSQQKKNQANLNVQEKNDLGAAATATAGPSSSSQKKDDNAAAMEKMQGTVDTLLNVVEKLMSLETTGTSAVAKSVAELKEEFVRAKKGEDERFVQLLAQKSNPIPTTPSTSNVENATPPESPISQASTPVSIEVSPVRSNASSGTPAPKTPQRPRSISPPPGSFFTSIFGTPVTPNKNNNSGHAPMTWVTPTRRWDFWRMHSLLNDPANADIQCLGFFPNSRKPGDVSPPKKKIKYSEVVRMPPPETATTQEQPITPYAQPGPSRLCKPVSDDLMQMPMLPPQAGSRRASNSSGGTSVSLPMPTLTPQLSPNSVARVDVEFPPLN